MCGRNSWSGGSSGPDGHREPVHGPEDADEVAPLHGQDLGQGGLALFERVGQDHLAHGAIVPSPKNMCSVRQRPMPVAPKATALARGACPRWCGPEVRLVRPGHELGELLVDRNPWPDLLFDEDLDDLRGLVSIRPSMTSPVVPSMEIKSPSRMCRPLTSMRCRRVIDVSAAADHAEASPSPARPGRRGRSSRRGRSECPRRRSCRGCPPGRFRCGRG